MKIIITISFGLSCEQIICSYCIIGSLLFWVFGGCGTLIDRKNGNDVGSGKEWSAGTYSYTDSALQSRWCICVVFASILEELTTWLWWRAVKSPGVCANKLPCFAFTLTKTFNWVTTSVSVLCLPLAQSSPLLVAAVANRSDLVLVSLNWPKLPFSKSQPTVHPEDTDFLEIIAFFLDVQNRSCKAHELTCCAFWK